MYYIWISDLEFYSELARDIRIKVKNEGFLKSTLLFRMDFNMFIIKDKLSFSYKDVDDLNHEIG